MVDLHLEINAVFTDERVNTAKSIDLVCASQFLISELTRQKLSMTHSNRSLTKNFIKFLSPSHQKASLITLQVSVRGSSILSVPCENSTLYKDFVCRRNITFWG